MPIGTKRPRPDTAGRGRLRARERRRFGGKQLIAGPVGGPACRLKSYKNGSRLARKAGGTADAKRPPEGGRSHPPAAWFVGTTGHHARCLRSDPNIESERATPPRGRLWQGSPSGTCDGKLAERSAPGQAAGPGVPQHGGLPVRVRAKMAHPMGRGQVSGGHVQRAKTSDFAGWWSLAS
jgi:hypothetical protein